MLKGLSVRTRNKLENVIKAGGQVNLVVDMKKSKDGKTAEAKINIEVVFGSSDKWLKFDSKSKLESDIRAALNSFRGGYAVVKFVETRNQSGFSVQAVKIYMDVDGANKGFTSGSLIIKMAGADKEHASLIDKALQISVNRNGVTEVKFDIEKGDDGKAQVILRGIIIDPGQITKFDEILAKFANIDKKLKEILISK
ncbi:hypothetical protein COX86_00985, partial [Candidatus Micrarchaeota archaeon CG_4_10_14_0_2_um_filter_60_11]